MSVALIVAVIVAAAAGGFCVGLWRELQEAKRSGDAVAEILNRANQRYVEQNRELRELLADRSRVEIGIPPKAWDTELDPRQGAHPRVPVSVIAEIEGLESQEARDEFMEDAVRYMEAHPGASAHALLGYLFPAGGVPAAIGESDA